MVNRLETRFPHLSPARIELLKLRLQSYSSWGGGVSNPVSIAPQISRTDFSVPYRRFRDWQNEFQTDKSIPIDRHLVHKDREENVLLSRLEKLDLDWIIGEIYHNLSHTFFYEHPKDHVPGLYILEAVRQFGTALAHLYYDVPASTSFILNDLQAHFYHFAETDRPLYIIANIGDKVYLENRLFQLNNHTYLIQNEKVIAEVTGNFKIFEITNYNDIRSGSKSRESSLVELNY